MLHLAVENNLVIFAVAAVEMNLVRVLAVEVNLMVAAAVEVNLFSFCFIVSLYSSVFQKNCLPQIDCR